MLLITLTSAQDTKLKSTVTTSVKYDFMWKALTSKNLHEFH
jgi:hypothetical protein